MLNSKKLKTFVISVLVLFSANAFSATLEDLVESRQGVMKLYAVNIDYLGDMIRERIPFNKKAAQDAADNLMALATLNTYILWPQGSGLDNPQLKGKTAARPEIWQNKQEVTLLQQDLVAALEVLVYNASWSLEGVSNSIKDVNRACVACHDKYMVEN